MGLFTFSNGKHQRKSDVAIAVAIAVCEQSLSIDYVKAVPSVLHCRKTLLDDKVKAQKLITDEVREMHTFHLAMHAFYLKCTHFSLKYTLGNW